MKLLTLIKKELRSLFCNPLSLAVITALNAIPIIMLAVDLNTSRSYMIYTGFEHIVAFMVIASAFAIPAVSVISVCREVKTGAREMLYSLSVSQSEIVLSKIISLSLFFAIPLLIMSPMPFVLREFGIVNFLQCYIAILMLLAFEIFVISMSVMISTRVAKSMIAIVIAYSALIVSFLCGVLSSFVRFLPFGTGFDKIFGGVLLELSFFKKTDLIVYELFDWTSLVFFIVGATVFTVIAVVENKKKLFSVIASLLLVATVGIMPVLLPYEARQIDINQNKLYTPSVSASKYLASVDDDVTVYIIDPYGNEQGLYNAILRTVAQGKNIRLEIVNSNEDRDILEKFGLDDVDTAQLAYAMIVEGPKRWKVITAADYCSYYNESKGHLSAEEFNEFYTYCAIVLNNLSSSYDSLSDSAKKTYDQCLQLFQSLEYETFICLQIENVFTEAVAYVTADSVPTAYFLSGHGEGASAELSFDISQNREIPTNADMLIINSPNEDYSNSEVDALIKYVDNGGKLCLFFGKDNYSMPNLARLLEYYGLSLDSNVIEVGGKNEITATVDKTHEAFSILSPSAVELENASKITTVENKKYTYSTILYYKHTEGEGESKKNYDYPVALSVSEGKEKRIMLFTGADVFGKDSNIGDEQLDRVSACRTSIEEWMFDGFSANITSTLPKLYQRPLYLADDAQIGKTVIIFSAALLMVTASLIAYIVTRKIRSKKATKKD